MQTRKFTRLERIGWWIVQTLCHWLENESDRQWEKQGGRNSHLGI